MLRENISLDKVAISISSFKSTTSVMTLLDKIFSSGTDFSEVIVVDSLSDKTLEAFIKEKEYVVTYYNSDNNLGSAGNLNKRLELASDNKKNDWCFCINHDGFFDRENIEFLVSSANKIKINEGSVGAVFPHRIRQNKKVDEVSNVKDEYKETLWDSSNGSLYSLEPYRSGCKVRGELWMGWEDLIYCLHLKDNGYKCFSSSSSVYYDSYEYKRVGFLGFDFYITDKPSWYSYYSIRNLVLGLNYVENKSYLHKKIISVFLKNIILSVFFRDNKIERLKLTFKGFFNGVRKKTGHLDMVIKREK